MTMNLEGTTQSLRRCRVGGFLWLPRHKNVPLRRMAAQVRALAHQMRSSATRESDRHAKFSVVMCRETDEVSVYRIR